MPGLHGFDVCRRLMGHPATRAIPVVMVTARASPSDRDRGLAAGADAYVTKPFSPKELLALLAALLAVPASSWGARGGDQGAEVSSARRGDHPGADVHWPSGGATTSR